MRFLLIPALALLATLAAATPVVELETRPGGSNNYHGGDTYCCHNTPVLGNCRAQQRFANRYRIRKTASARPPVRRTRCR